jgi:hypothetical protein
VCGGVHGPRWTETNPPQHMRRRIQLDDDDISCPRVGDVQPSPGIHRQTARAPVHSRASRRRTDSGWERDDGAYRWIGSISDTPRIKDQPGWLTGRH